QPDAFGEQVWQTYESEWPQFNIHRYSRQEARMKVVLGFMRNMVFSDEAMVGDWTRLKKSETGEIIAGLLDAGRITGCSLEGANGYIATEDICLLDSRGLPGPRHSVHILHKADYLTRAFESRLKSRYSDKEVLQYVLLNGEISGAVEGHWRIGPHDVENISIDPDAVLYEGQADEIMEAVKAIYKKPYSNVLRFNGNLI
ncbi:MAG: hypothetical protein JXB33_06475, partial [Clostridia bacterium]|nr:hypothetical protein [Clostridia bacterium]